MKFLLLQCECADKNKVAQSLLCYFKLVRVYYCGVHSRKFGVEIGWQSILINYDECRCREACPASLMPCWRDGNVSENVVKAIRKGNSL